eukprot:6215043-Prymnesium_polylepis.1
MAAVAAAEVLAPAAVPVTRARAAATTGGGAVGDAAALAMLGATQVADLLVAAAMGEVAVVMDMAAAETGAAREAPAVARAVASKQVLVVLRHAAARAQLVCVVLLGDPIRTGCALVSFVVGLRVARVPKVGDRVDVPGEARSWGQRVRCVRVWASRGAVQGGCQRGLHAGVVMVGRGSIEYVRVPAALVQGGVDTSLVRGCIPTVEREAIQTPANQWRMREANVGGCRVHAVRSIWVAVIVVILTLARVGVAFVDLAAGPRELSPVVIIGKERYAVDGDSDCARLRHVDTIERPRHRVARWVGAEARLGAHATVLSGIPAWWQWNLVERLAGRKSIGMHHEILIIAPCSLHMTDGLEVGGKRGADARCGLRARLARQRSEPRSVIVWVVVECAIRLGACRALRRRA